MTRTGLDQADGRQRPIGLPTFEANIVQRAVAMRVGAVYAQAVHDGAHGVRAGHRPHQALPEWREPGLEWTSGGIVEAEVRGGFDRGDPGLGRDVRRKRVNDGGIWRRIGQWRHAGGLDGEP